MSEHKHYKIDVVKVPKKWKANAFIDKDAYEKLYRQERRQAGQVLGQGRQAHRLDQALHHRQEHFVRLSRYLDQMVRGRHAQRRRQLHRPASEEARQAGRHHLGAGRSQRPSQAHHLSRAAPRSLPPGQCAEGQRGQARRPGHDLSADDPRSRLRHAGLRPHRRGALDRVRRVLARLAGGAHHGLQIEIPDHRRRGPARRP